MKQHVATCFLVACLPAVAASVGVMQGVQAQSAPANRKACDFLTKSDAEALLGTSVQDRSQGADCWFVETGWTNKPPKNRAIRFGLTDSASPKPDAVVELRRNAEQYLPPGGGIRDITDFGDVAYWLWIPGFGGTLTAFQGGKVTVSVNITGLPEEEALRKAEALASKPFGGSGPTGYAYQRPAPQLRASASPPTSPSVAPPPTSSTTRTSPPTAAPNAQSRATLQTFCSSDLDQPVIYVSREFDTHLSGSSDTAAEDIVELALVGDAFAEFLTNMYRYRSNADRPTDCFHGYGDASRRDTRSAWEAKQRAAGKRIVETAWPPASAPNQRQ